MAQTQLVSTSRSVEMASDNRNGLDQIEMYERFVSFRDAVLSGSHPRIKVPAHVQLAKSGHDPVVQSTSTSSTSSPPSKAVAAATNGRVEASGRAPAAPPASRLPNSNRDKAMENQPAFQANSLQPAVPANFPGLGALSSNGPGGASVSNTSPRFAQPTGSARADINPIFLEKSDHLIKTEIQLQRKRLERALKEQLVEKHNATRALQPIEALPDFDLEDVLQQAQALVNKAAPPSTDANAGTNKSVVESDSFDENSFYSSQFDSPNSNHVSRIPERSASPEDVEMEESSDYEPEPVKSVTQGPDNGKNEAHPVAPPASQQPSQPPQPTEPQRRPPSFSRPSPMLPEVVLVRETQKPNPSTHQTTAAASDSYSSARGRAAQAISSQESADASGSGESGNTDNETSHDQRLAQLSSQARFPGVLGNGIGATVVRAHDLSPLAPQPSHVSPLVAAMQQPIDLEARQNLRATPAQVSALRNEVPAGSSPESSPQAGNGADKRKGKKKKNKRKSDRQMVEATPYIKPEPRSPSPFSDPPAARPHKRLRPVESHGDELQYNEPIGLDTSAPTVYRERYVSYRDEPPRVVYARHEEPLREGLSSAQRYESGRHEARILPASSGYIRRPESPGAYPTHQFASGEARPVRSVSYAQVDRAYREPPVYYRDTREEPRMSVRYGGDRDRSRSPVMREARAPAMGPPPRVQPVRILVDQYGREIIESPAPQYVTRQSVAPTARHGEEIMYEHAPRLRAASRIPERVVESYGDGITYMHGSPAPMSAPRRVITEPEYLGGEYRSYRQREYSVRPPGAIPVEEFARASRPPPDRRPVVDESPATREVLSRAASVRPGAEAQIRYEGTRGYGGERYGSVRPELVPAREYAASVHPPEGRREIPPPPPREYSVRPESQVIHRAYSVHPEAQAIQRPYSVRPVEQPYYERQIRGGEEVMYIEQRPAPPPQASGGNGGGGVGAEGLEYMGSSHPGAVRYDSYR